MRLFYSGGSPIPEVTLDKPDIMLSAFVDARNWKPNARLRKIMEIRREDKLTKKRRKKCSKSTGKSSSKSWKKSDPG